MDVLAVLSSWLAAAGDWLRTADWVELLTNLAVLLEVIWAIALFRMNREETRYLEQELRPRLRADESLPLFDVLVARSKGVSRVGLYLIVVTAFGAGLAAGAPLVASWTGVTIPASLAAAFPPIRAINGLIFIYLIAGPRQTGEALRARPRASEAEAAP